MTLKQFYIPKYFNETNDLEKIMVYGSPYGVIDALEIFSDYNKETDLIVQLNQIFDLNKLSLKMINGYVKSIYINQIQNSIVPIYEVGLKELIEDAVHYYEEDNIKIAVEKMWDAFERLKTYYFPDLNKKESAKKIVRNTSNSNNEESYMVMFEKEDYLTILTMI